MISRRNKYIPPTILRLYIQIKFTFTTYFKKNRFNLEFNRNYFGLEKKSVFFHPVNIYSISFENHDKHELQYIGYRCFCIQDFQFLKHTI